MKVYKKYPELLILAILMLFPGLVFAQDGEDEKNIELNGFLMGNFSARTTSQRPAGREGKDLLLAEERLRLDIFGWTESIEASARVKVDFLFDNVAGEFHTDLREVYLDYTTGNFDFRLGRQVITWGVGDLLFINDVFPKDWVSFFSGRPLEYLKIGSDGFRTRYSSEAMNVEMIIIPFFEPDNLPTSKRFFLYDPFSAVPLRTEEEPETTLENTELALRLYRRIGDFDVSAYAYKGFWRTPSVKLDNVTSPTRVTIFYPELSVYGLSAQGSALHGIVSFEIGYYHSREDEDGDDPMIPNSQIRFLVGYQRQIWEDFTLGVQYYGEIMEDYSAYRSSLPSGFPAQEEYRDIVTLRLEQFLKHQTLRLSIFTFYSPVDNDYLIRPLVSYKFTDRLSSTLGANIFGGEKDTTFLGQFGKNDNIYLSVRFDF
jgi:hypothetical protein